MNKTLNEAKISEIIERNMFSLFDIGIDDEDLRLKFEEAITISKRHIARELYHTIANN
jgi:hypothetical protein